MTALASPYISAINDSSGGFGADAQHLFDLLEKASTEPSSTHWKRASAVGKLRLLAHDYQEPNWDGYGAVPIDNDTIDQATRLLNCLPGRLPDPDLGAEPDGFVTMEWYARRQRYLSLSVGPDERLVYVVVRDGRVASGVAWFLSDFPETILRLIDEIQNR